MHREKNSHLIKATMFLEDEKKSGQDNNSKSSQGRNDDIDQGLSNTILTHILSNYTKDLKAPLLLGICGDPGEGKTYQTMKICNQNGINMFYFSMTEFNNVNDSHFLSEIELDYKRACSFYYTLSQSPQTPCVVVIDDISLKTKLMGENAMATAEDNSMVSANNDKATIVADKDTSNYPEKAEKATLERNCSELDNRTQLLTALLVKLCMQAEIREDFRIPIILIGDSLEGLYNILRRENRMDFYRWKQSEETKIRIIRNIFENKIEPNEEEQFDAFLEKHIDKPISWFVVLKYVFVKEKIQKYVRTQINKNFLKSINECNKLALERVKVAELEVLAEI